MNKIKGPRLNLPKRKIYSALIVLLGGIILSAVVFFNTQGMPFDIGMIKEQTAKDQVIQQETDEFGHQDEKIEQQFKVEMINGANKGEMYIVKNNYQKSQLKTDKYQVGQRVMISFVDGKASLVQPKRDWVLVIGVTLIAVILVLVVGMHTWQLLVSLVLNGLLFYLFLRWDLLENGTIIVQIYLLATLIFSLVSLVIVQGINKKMLATWIATVLGVLLSFGICYGIMKLTHETGIRYEAVDYATQNPKTLFLAQALIGVLGAVMDETTDIISSLAELINHQPNVTKKQIWQSGLNIGKEIMGPLINVLVLIFMAAALPMTVLLIRDLNTISYTFQFALSIGILQSLISAVGIVLTVPISAGIGMLLAQGKEH